MSSDSALLSLDVDIKIVARITRGESSGSYSCKNCFLAAGSVLECGSSLSDCDTIIDQVLSSRGDHGTVHSPGLVSRVERILGVNSGDRLQVVIPRDDDDLDYISEKTLFLFELY